MNDEIKKKLEELILKALEKEEIGHAETFLAMRETIAHIKNMEKE